MSWVPEEELRTVLVYAGPRYFGVYRRAAPERRITTELGEAQVWSVVN